MNRSLLAGLAGILLALTGASAAQAAPVTIRVEGPSSALVKARTVDPATVGNLVRDGGDCNGTNTAAGALELGTAGNWNGTNYGGSLGVFINSIMGVDYSANFDRSWGLYINGVSAQLGACSQAVQNGDEVLFAATCGSATTDCLTGGVLDAKAVATAKPGVALPVTVTQTISDYPAPAPTTTPAPGAVVTGGGATATANGQGVANITLTQRGSVELRVTREKQVPDSVSVCVTDGADGYCGTTKPDGTTLPPEIGGTPVAPATPAAVAAPDTAAPVASVTGIKTGQRFSRKKAPRELKAKVDDASGILQVKLSLTRQVGKKCWAFSGKTEKFKRVKCGAHPVFKVGGTTDISYLLPKRLGKGRYVFDVRATDSKYNRDELARGRNRVVFTVR